MEKWEDTEEYRELKTNLNKCEDVIDKIITNRVEIFQKMNIKDLDEQRHLVDLINNVVWEREVSFQRTKTQLELSFTPEVKGMLNEKS